MFKLFHFEMEAVNVCNKIYVSIISIRVPQSFFCFPGQLLLFVGTHRGLLKWFQLFSGEDAVKMNDTGEVITNGEDGLSISYIDVASIHQNEIVVVTKNHCLLTFIVGCNGKVSTAIDYRLAVLSCLQITGNFSFFFDLYSMNLNLNQFNAFNLNWLTFSWIAEILF